MAAKKDTGAAKAPAKNAGTAAAPAAPAAAEQLATQPAAPSENAAPVAVTQPGSTEQPVSEAAALEGGNTGQDAQSDTAQAAADAAAATSLTPPAAEQAPVGGGDGLDDEGDVEGLWVTAIPEQGFRRCGFRFTREGVGIGLSALTPEQIELLENEPNLKVERGIFSGRVGVQE